MFLTKQYPNDVEKILKTFNHLKEGSRVTKYFQNSDWMPNNNVMQFQPVIKNQPESKSVQCNFSYMNIIEENDITVAVLLVEDFYCAFPRIPFHMINFQKPDIIRMSDEKVKNVGICVQFTYEMPKIVPQWLKLQEDLNVAKIIPFDYTVTTQ